MRADLLLSGVLAGILAAVVSLPEDVPRAESAGPASGSGTEMRLVPGGTFRTGTDPDDLEAVRAATGLTRLDPLLPEVPGHEVTVGDFFIDVTDVTNRQFAEFVSAEPSWSKRQLDASRHNGRYLEHWPDGNPPDDLLEHPVTFVTWQAAAAFCDWGGKRLPTEHEHEWAAQDPGKRTEYPWGDQPPDGSLVNWSGSGIGATVAVGSYPPNPRGLYDMAGNVWRFTADPWLGAWEEMLEDPAKADTARDDPSIRRVVKGGSWGAHAANLRIRYRDSHRPLDAREMVGFRCARSAGEPEP